MRPLDPKETDYLQASVEKIYTKFTELVAEGRDMTVPEVDDIAQGRVWTGAEALEIGLVDQIGTIEDAVNYAAMSIDGVYGMEDVQVVEYPKPLTTVELLLEELTGAKDGVFAGTALESVENAFRDCVKAESGKAYARLPYEIILKSCTDLSYARTPLKAVLRLRREALTEWSCAPEYLKEAQLLHMVPYVLRVRRSASD